MLRDLPSVDRVLSHERLQQMARHYPHDLLVDLIRRELEDARRAAKGGKTVATPDEIAESVAGAARSLETTGLRPVVNATGVILHTNLGRAPLSEETQKAMLRAATGYCDLEFDLDTSGRGDRNNHIEPLVCRVTGAEAALAVNNNASGVMLGLAAVARGKEVIVSRGQAVEIGGSFRIPDVMRQSGARLVEVGTTNCTYIGDYERAIGPKTAALLRVHSSNFRIVGFSHDVPLSEMVSLGEARNIPVLDDLGSGCFLDTTVFGLGPEPMVQQSLSAGVALVFFSGDKLVGGPQAGIICGKSTYTGKLKKHPLMRALRLDKVRLAGLAATLMHYLRGEAVFKIPVWQMIAAPVPELEKRAVAWVRALPGATEVIDGESVVGGGSLPGGTLPTRLLGLRPAGKARISKIVRTLQARDVPVIGRVSEDALLLDPRSVMPDEDRLVLEALESLEPALR